MGSMSVTREPLETAELLAFVRTVEARSLSRAADMLGVPRATLSRRLARLEERLGARLLRRTTRSLLLTDAGHTFLEHARRALETLDTAAASVRSSGQVMRGELRVSVPPGLDTSFAFMIAKFARQHPEVRLQVDASSRIVDLVREGYDLALRASPAIQPGLIARTLSRHQLIAVASPAYLAAHGTPRTVKDLRKHRCLTGFARGEVPKTAWPVGRGTAHVESAFATNDLTILREAALQGAGIALLPTLIVADELEAGSLVHVLRGLVGGETQLAVVYPERKLLPFHVRTFIDTLVEWATELEWSKQPRHRSVSSSTQRARVPEGHGEKHRQPSGKATRRNPVSA